jgi:hypothetical protein
MPQSPSGPHAAIEADHPRDRFALELFDVLWGHYRQRVSHVAAYEQVIRDAGATFVNDHIAFRTFACQRPMTGISSISRIFEALGYVPAACYHFEDKHLEAIHFQHPHPQFPKLFISELNIWQLPAEAREMIATSLQSHRGVLADANLAALANIESQRPPRREDLLNTVVKQFHELPWSVPEKRIVESLNAHSQYAAWVLVHGYNVNHFTSLINSHGKAALNTIDKTVAALKNAGVPMKSEIEGKRGSKLRQSATEAAVVDVAVRENGQEATIPWTYAYFELAERGNVVDPETGQKSRFQGFLGPQATNLFEMTKVRGK